MNGKIGLQLYSIRRKLNAENFHEIMNQISKIGYDGVEFYQFYSKPASEVRAVLEGCGLEPVSSHVGIENLRNNLEDTLEYHKEIGCNNIIVPYLPSKSFKNKRAIRKTSDELSKIADELNARGFDFGYHNHFHEFFTLNGVTAFETFAKEIPNSVGLQPDVGHIRKGGVEPVAFLEKLENPYVSFHIKDIEGKEGFDIPLGRELTVEEAEELGEKFEDVRLGNGIINLPSIVNFGEKLNVSWFIVEDESAVDPLEAVGMDYRYLNSL